MRNKIHQFQKIISLIFNKINLTLSFSILKNLVIYNPLNRL